LFPGILEIFQPVAPGGAGGADALQARSNAEALQQMRQLLGGDGAFEVPGTTFQVLQRGKQIAGRDAFGKTALAEDVVNVGQ